MKIILLDTIIFLWLAILMTSCTISFQNISTHGIADDIVDQEQGATADVNPVITVPLSPL